jgi:predicted nucleic acid-binding protein
LTCEAVITEACFLLQNLYAGEDSIFGLLRDNLLTISFHLEDEIVSINELMNRYQSVPMSFADACLVRMSELYPDSIVLTLDSDFTIYRKNRNQVISLIIPSSN